MPIIGGFFGSRVKFKYYSSSKFPVEYLVIKKFD